MGYLPGSPEILHFGQKKGLELDLWLFIKEIYGVGFDKCSKISYKHSNNGYIIRWDVSSKLAELLFKDYRRRVLELLLLHPDKRYHVREIARLTGTVAGTLHKELAKQADAGLLIKESVGNQVVYQANPDCPILEELTKLLEKTTEYTRDKSGAEALKMDDIVEKYRRQILALAKENGVRNVRVFGSMARNEAAPDSDLDLLVDIENGKSGLALGGFLIDVSEVVHRKVDVVTEKSLHPTIRKKVLHEARAL